MPKTADARGLACPMPLVMAKTAMEELERGDVLVVLATDPEATIDLTAWARERGHPINEEQLPGWTEFTLRRGDD